VLRAAPEKIAGRVCASRPCEQQSDPKGTTTMGTHDISHEFEHGEWDGEFPLQATTVAQAPTLVAAYREASRWPPR